MLLHFCLPDTRTKHQCHCSFYLPRIGT
uniref:Uncharacterized protein n=1 Tax=Arundo donax TaxID=35708 RepID=A0A0A9AEK9_ARUDO